MPGILICVLVLGILALLIGLLLIPVGMRLRAKLNPWGGRARLTIGHPLVKKEMFFRLHLLEQPCFQVERILKDGTLKRLKTSTDKKWKLDRTVAEALRSDISVHFFRLLITEGVQGKADWTALAAGALQALCDGGLGLMHSHLRVREAQALVLPKFDQSILSLELDCMIHVLSVKNILIILRKSRKKA